MRGRSSVRARRLHPRLASALDLSRRRMLHHVPHVHFDGGPCAAEQGYHTKNHTWFGDYIITSPQHARKGDIQTAQRNPRDPLTKAAYARKSQAQKHPRYGANNSGGCSVQTSRQHSSYYNRCWKQKTKYRGDGRRARRPQTAFRGGRAVGRSIGRSPSVRAAFTMRCYLCAVLEYAHPGTAFAYVYEEAWREVSFWTQHPPLLFAPRASLVRFFPSRGAWSAKRAGCATLFARARYTLHRCMLR